MSDVGELAFEHGPIEGASTIWSLRYSRQVSRESEDRLQFSEWFADVKACVRRAEHLRDRDGAKDFRMNSYELNP
jgi:hypothetical protein